MMEIRLRKVSWLLMLTLVVGMGAVASPALGGETWLAAAEEDLEPVAPADGETSNPLPVKIGANYAMLTDWVWRGLNMSEYPGEGREKLNHHAGLSLAADLKDLGLGDLGTIKASAQFQFFVGNESQNARANTKLQRVDYTVSWQYTIPESPFTIGAGWIAYEYPHAADTFYSTYEVFGMVAMDDGFIYDEDKGVLNPSLAYFYDYDDIGAGVLVGAIEHEFALDDAVEGTPVLRDITITPSASIILDNRYLDSALGTNHHSTKFSSAEIGLAANYDLGTALEIPEDLGSIKLTVFTNFSHAFRRKILDDEFYGGFKVGWEW